MTKHHARRALHSGQEDFSEEVGRKVRECATDFRNRGMTFEEGITRAAEALGMRERRARALIFDDAVRVYLDEYTVFKALYLRHLKHEEIFLQARLDVIRKKILNVGKEGWSSGSLYGLFWGFCISCTSLHIL